MQAVILSEAKNLAGMPQQARCFADAQHDKPSLNSGIFIVAKTLQAVRFQPAAFLKSAAG